MSKLQIVKEDSIASHIYFLRGHNVILDFDLATLYGVETRALKQAVKRNLRRFPEDFKFGLDENEINEPLASMRAVSGGRHSPNLQMIMESKMKNK